MEGRGVHYSKTLMQRLDDLPAKVSWVCLPNGIRNTKKSLDTETGETNGGNEEQTHGYLHKSPNPWASGRSCRTCTADFHPPLAGSPLCDSGSRSAAKRRGRKLNFPRIRAKKRVAGKRASVGCVDTDFSENYIERDREAKGSTRARSRRLAYFAANWRPGNKLVLSSRREYLRGPYTSPMRARWIPNEAAISGGELSALKCDRYVCKMKR